MTDLDDDGRSLFDLARAAYEPNEQQRELVLGRVLKRAVWSAAVGSTLVHGAKAAGAGTSIVGASAAGATASTSGASLALKALLWCAVGSGIGTAGYAVSRVVSNLDSPRVTEQARRPTHDLERNAAAAPQRTQHLQAPRELQAQPVIAEPVNAARVETSRPSGTVEPAPSARAGLAELREPSAGVASGTAAFPDAPLAHSAPRRSNEGVSLGEEAQGLAAVQEALRAGRGAEALRLIDAQQQRFAAGALQDEREAARVLALCSVGRVAEAQHRARDLLTRSPDSPFAARIRASCAGSGP